MEEKKKGFFARLKEGLTKTRNSIVSGIDSVFRGFTDIDDDFYEEIEEILIMGDLGVDATEKILTDMKQKVKELHLKEPHECKEVLIDSIRRQMDLGENAYEFEHRKSVVLVIGVNGVGKTTSIGKLADQLKAEGNSVLLAAADTFRAAAIDQLEEWGKRANVGVISHKEGSDPAAVIFDAVQAAKAKQEAYIAQQSAEQTRAELEKATQTADVIVKAQISKQQAEIEAEAQAEVVRRKAKGEADAIFAKMEAEAKGNQEILTKQAEGMRKLVEAAGGDANAAVRLIVADKLEELISIQVEAIKNIKIDKITVWDTGAGADGKGSTANFLSGLMQSVPPLNDLFKQAGMSLPDFLGEDIQEALKKSQEEAVKRAAEADNAETLDPKDVEVIEPEK
jgi:nucleoside-triphosphatase THEP1